MKHPKLKKIKIKLLLLKAMKKLLKNWKKSKLNMKKINVIIVNAQILKLLKQKME